MENRVRQTQAYQWFFPVGLLFGMLGAGLWVVFRFQAVPFYPGVAHAEIMVTGFLMAVASGFLMTAIPRFTGTKPAQTGEKSLLLLIFVFLLAVSLHPNRVYFNGGALALSLVLLGFVFRRVRVCVFTPPPSFVLTAFGVLSFLTSHTLLVISHWQPLPGWALHLARILLYYGLPQGLILGVGTQMIPALLGLKKTVLTQIQQNEERSRVAQTKYLFFGLIALLLLVSYVLESLDLAIGRLLRAFVITAIVIFQWNYYRFPQKRGVFIWCLWFSGLFFLLGAWPGVFWPSLAVHGAHILFIGSVSLMIFTIATRVTLAHGGHEMRLEQNSVALALTLLFLLIAMLARLSVPFIDHGFEHLAYAGALWILAAVTWSSVFLKKILKRNL